MCFVEQEQSVELVAEPCQDLVKSAIATSFASQGGVGSEQDGIADLDPGAGTDTAQGLNVERRPAERLPVAAGVLTQGAAIASPEVAPVPAKQIGRATCRETVCPNE